MDKPAVLENEHYKLLDEIGRGGMGIVYRAIDKKVGNRTVAIKTLLKEYGSEKDIVERFHREVCFTANFNHRNIVTVFTLDEFDGSPCMVMEYLEGQSISKIIESERPFPLIEKIGLLIQVCDGLQYAHEQHVIHRDIKPANILVLKDGLAKIVDFGIARTNANRTLTLTGQAIGSPYYMSPEQISATTPVDARTDIYSTGVTLYEFLTGEVPFKGPDLSATISKILNEPVPSLGKHLSNYPVALDEILQKAMAKSAEERYQTAEDLGYELSRFQENLKRGMTEEFLAQAKAAIKRKDWDLARKQLHEVRRFDKRNSEANELIKFVNEEIQKQQKSVQIAQLRSQAQIALAGKQYEEALECVAQALRLDPDDNELVLLSQSIKDQVTQARELNEALSRGQAALFVGDLDEAALAVQKVLEIDGRHTEARALENQIRKELEERQRRAQIQGLLDDARSKISSQDYLAALLSLQKAQAIDPADSNIRELLSWARRGHEQEKLRKELQTHATDIGQLLSNGAHAAALAACEVALQRFPEDSSLLKLQQLAKRQGEAVARRQAVDKVSAEARRLVEADKSEEALVLLEESLKTLPGDQDLETLLTIAREESERKRREKEERELQENTLLAGEISGGEDQRSRQKIQASLDAFQDGLKRRLPIVQLRSLAEHAERAVGQEQVNASESARYSAALAEFKVRSAKWAKDGEELAGIEKAIREVRGGANIDAPLERARFLSEQHGRDEDIRGRFERIRQLAEEYRLRREAAVGRVSALVDSIQATQDLAIISSIEEQLKSASAPWREDPSIRGFVEDASAHVGLVRQQKQDLLQQLALFSTRLSGARSAGVIRLQLEQARLVSADSDDAEINAALQNLQSTAKARLGRLEAIIRQLQGITEKITSSRSLDEAESYLKTAQTTVEEGGGFEEARDPLRRIEHAVGEKRKEHRRLSRSLDSLIVNSAQAVGLEELELILVNKRSLLEGHAGDQRLRELERQLETAVRERREYLARNSILPPPETRDSDSKGYEETLITPRRGARPERLVGMGQHVPASKPKWLYAVAVIATVILISGSLYYYKVTRNRLPTAPANQASDVADRPATEGSGHPEKQAGPSISPEPPKQPGGAIVLHVKEPSVKVTLDDRKKGIGETNRFGDYVFPSTTRPGLHTVTLSKDGFQDFKGRLDLELDKPITQTIAKLNTTSDLPTHTASTKIDLVAGGNPANVATSPQGAAPPEQITILKVTAPKGATVKISGGSPVTSEGSAITQKVTPGAVPVEVAMDGFETLNRNVTVSAGETTNFEPELKAKTRPIEHPQLSEEDRSQIQRVLDSLATALTNKDIGGMKSVWPSMHSDTEKSYRKNVFPIQEKGSYTKLRLTNVEFYSGNRAIVACEMARVQVIQGEAHSLTGNPKVDLIKNGQIWQIQDFSAQ